MELCIWFSNGMCLKFGKQCILHTGDIASRMLECEDYEKETENA